MLRLHSDEAGFTLTELLAAIGIGLILLMAAAMLLDRASSASQEIADRQDAVQRGRHALEIMVRQLRSQVCLGDEEEPITYAGKDMIEFYADLSDGSRNPERRRLIYDAEGKRLIEQRYAGVGEYPALTFPSSPSTTRVLATRVERIVDPSGPRDVFRYYAFDPDGGPGALQQMSAPGDLTADQKALTALLKVGFRVMPDRRRPRDRDALNIESDVYVRIADPSRPAEGPRCI